MTPMAACPEPNKPPRTDSSGKHPVIGGQRRSGFAIMQTMRVFVASTVLLLHGALAASAQTVAYSDDILPLLQARCHECHYGPERRGGLSMNSRESLLEGGEFGPVLVPGDSANSLLIELVSSDDPDERMPSRGDPLSRQEIALLAAWIDAGLPWDEPSSVSDAWDAMLAPREVSVPAGIGIHGSKHPVDRFIRRYLDARNASPLPVVSDRLFIRRAYLDIVGLVPEPDTVRAFVENKNPKKREDLIDALLADRQSYAEHWMTFWNDALRNDFEGTGYIDGGRKQITGWLYRALDDNLPYDQFVTQLIAPDRRSEGFINGIKWRGATNASQQVPLQAAQNVAEVFLGINLKCASCHDSFINEWKLADAYGLANAFSREPLEMYRCDAPIGHVAETKFLWPELGSVRGDAPLEERRAEVAALVTHDRNGRFARTMTNRIWAALMGRGLVEPLKAMDEEPWNADLLDWLAVTFADSNYDVKALIRLIATSTAYQLEADRETGSSPEYVFTGPIPRRLTVEQFYDAMSGVTGVWQQDAEYNPKSDDASRSYGTTRAWRVPADGLMRALGRPNREQPVLERDPAFTRLQALELTNGDTLAAFLSRAAHTMIASGPVQPERVFEHAIGRAPTPAERRVLVAFAPSPNTPEAVEDVLWIVFNHPEFHFVL